MRNPLPFALALALLALSGCTSDGGGGTGDEDGTPTDDPAAPPAGSAPQVHDGSGTIAAGVGNDQAGSFTFGAGGALFAVPASATLMFVELAWDSPALALDLCVHAPADGDLQ